MIEAVSRTPHGRAGGIQYTTGDSSWSILYGESFKTVDIFGCEISIGRYCY